MSDVSEGVVMGYMLTQNSGLRPLGIYNWTIPALSAVLSDGRRVKTCPSAGVYSLGGKEDHLVDRERDRHCDVFPSVEAARAAGYMPQSEDDRLCVTLPTRSEERRVGKECRL